MPTDGVFIHHLTKELKSDLLGGRINKIYQPAPLMIILQIRNKTSNYNLLLSSILDAPRVHITNQKLDNPPNPLNFCMILRKYIERGEIVDISQFHNDRLIILHIKAINELGDEEVYLLITELMGRNSNIILINSQNIIIDAIRKVPPSVNNTRMIIPKAHYEYPITNKIDPFTNQNATPDSDLEGVSKPLLIEAKERNNIYDIINQATKPTLFIKDKIDYYAFDLFYIDGERRFFPTISQLLDFYYTTCLNTKSEDVNNVKKVIKAKLKSCHKKEDNLLDDIDKANDNLIYNEYGILLQSYLYLIKKGDKEVNVTDYLHDNVDLVIELDPYKEPSENLKVFFSKGKKAKKTLIEANKQLTIVKEEISYLEDILFQLDNVNGTDLIELKEELMENGYLKKNAKTRMKKVNNRKMNIIKLTIDDIDIYVGKNNLQNAYLTTVFANIHDYWFHVKDAPGSHVILRVPDNDLEFILTEHLIRTCANLSAYYSTYRNSSSVPVNYTKVKYIKKIPGKKGCNVIYSNNSTIYIDPLEPKLE